MEHSNKPVYKKGIQMSERIVVLSGPSAAGKTEISKEIKKLLNVEKVISCTTRDPRPGEVNGVDYYFFTRVDFLETIRRGEFVEHFEVHGKLYGTHRDDLDAALSTGKIVVLVVDIQGLEAIARIYPDAQTFFITAPKEDLIRRLNERDMEESKRQERIEKLDDELFGMNNPFVKVRICNSDEDDMVQVAQKISDRIVFRVGRQALRES